MKSKKTMYIIYQTTCMSSGKIYIGAHACSSLKDGYLGSGKLIKAAIKKYGKENFIREILFLCGSEYEMYSKEAELVTEEFVVRDDNYNLVPGGFKGYNSKDTIPVIDQNGQCFRINREDPRYLSGELRHNMSGMCTVINENGDRETVSSQEKIERHLDSIQKGKQLLFNTQTQKYFMATKDEVAEQLSTGEVIYASSANKLLNAGTEKYLRACEKRSQSLKGQKFDKTKARLQQYENQKRTIIVIDQEGTSFRTTIDDPRFLSGELQHIRKNQKMPTSFKEKIAKYIFTLETPDGLLVETKTMKGFAAQYNFIPMFKVGRKTLTGWKLIGKRLIEKD